MLKSYCFNLLFTVLWGKKLNLFWKVFLKRFIEILQMGFFNLSFNIKKIVFQMKNSTIHAFVGIEKK